MHHCAGACCCPSRRDAIQKGSSLAHKVLFRAAPSTPAANKWSKLGPVLDWVLLNMLCHSILLNLMLSLQVRPAAKEGQDDDDVDESLRQELNFAALKGKRWQACTDFFMIPEHVTTMIYLALTLEPLRSLTAWWMRRGRDVDNPLKVPMLDMLYEGTSPLLVSLQYIASLLDGTNDRLLLAFRRSSSSYQEWCEAQGSEVRKCRRFFLAAGLVMYRRHWLVYHRLPWSLLKIVDPRTSQSEREAVMADFDDAADCCLPPGLARQLRQCGITAQQLFEDEDLRRFLCWVAELVGQQIVDLEWRHGRNRKRSNSHGQTRMDSFVARAVNAEARMLHQARWDLQRLRETQPAVEEPTPEPRAQHEKKRLRASTAAELHLWEFTSAKRAQGQKTNMASAPLRTSAMKSQTPTTPRPS